MSDDKKYRLKVNLKINRTEVIRKGTVYDSTKDDVPGVVLNEVKLGTGTVEVLSAESVPQPSEQTEVKDHRTAAEIKTEEFAAVRAKAEVEAKAIDDTEAELRKQLDDAKKEKEVEKVDDSDEVVVDEQTIVIEDEKEEKTEKPTMVTRKKGKSDQKENVSGKK